MTAGKLTRILHWSLLAVVVGCVLWAGAWRLSGGRWERVETASMGTIAPVNTLLWIEPLDQRTLQVGDFVTFRAPGHPELTYSHLIAAIHPDGTIETQGSITARDPWLLTRDDIVGQVMWRWKGVGWLVVAAPLLLVGGLALVGAVSCIRTRRWRAPAATVGVALLLSLAIVVHRPLVRAQELGFVEVPAGARATYVSTGLAPLRLEAHRGGHVDLVDGEVGSVIVTKKDAHGRYGIRMSPRIPPWWWLVLIGACFVPALRAGGPDDADSIDLRARHRSLRPSGGRA